MSNPFRLIVTRVLQVATLLAAMGCTAAFLSDGDEDRSVKKSAGKSIAFVENKTYQTECTSCHVGYLPGFLPDRSWKKIMGDLENHFGENASLENPTKDEIIKYLTATAADRPGATPRSKRIAKMISSSDAPIRITETPFWTKKHSSIRAYVWKREKVGGKSRCEACHRDANKGIFTEHDVHIPKQ